MRKHRKYLAMAALWLLSGCGGGGGGGDSAGSSSGSADASGTLQLLEHTPADGAVQVAVGAALAFVFDADVALDSLGDEDTWLRVAGTTANLPGSWRRSGAARLEFQPAAPLERETDYEFQLSAMTCDGQGRILDVQRSFAFRTVDTTAPALVSVDVADQATGVDRTRTFTLTFDEGVAAASLTAESLYLRDAFGHRWAGSRTVAGATVVFDPHADLPGDRLFQLVVTDAVTDRAGNRLASGATTRFTTGADGDSPAVLTVWPPHLRTGVSPLVQPTFSFSESMDPASVEAASLLFQDEYGSVVPFAVHSSDDQRTLRLRPLAPLQPNRQYTMAFLLGGAGATDVSGNVLTSTQALVFQTGSDQVAPAIASSVPGGGESRVSGNVVPTVTFGEPMDPDWIDASTVRLLVDGAEWTAVVDRPQVDTIRLTPVLTLPANASCRIVLQGGHAGLRDLAGNVLAADLGVAFTTSGDATFPQAILMPPDGATAIATSSRASVVFDAPMDASTMTTATIRLTTDDGTPVPGSLVVGGGNRTATFVPTSALQPFTYYRWQVRGGSAGVRRSSGNWFSADQTARFRTGGSADTQAPQVAATLNGIDSTRRDGLVVPQHGFTIDVTVSDGGATSADMASLEVALQGTGIGPGPATLFAAATVSYGTFRVRVPSTAPLGAGEWTMTVHCRDLSGNRGSSAPLAFQVAQATGNLLPFERVQVVWVRADLDRDGNGTGDFADDLLRLGLGAAGDPLGRNARLREIVLDGILAQANHLYGRGSRGEPLDPGSVGLRFTPRQPTVAHMQMALGGFDPEGPRGRDYGDESTGVLGRAYYDYRNGNPGERNVSTSPGLGVFPSEMWLYQSRIHLQVWPSFQTVFARRFQPLAPDLGGTPAGSHALDAVVLDPAFDFDSANSSERARYLTIMQAADDWATVMGIVLAHEVGHSVGLVAPGPAPSGLFGDSSLHDSFAGAAEVMAPSVGYEAMLTLDYAFRDIDLAYLRQRVLLR